ncbi:TniQ family protein, partial [Nostoc cycadae]|uniref:TniQ family protein n=1 Tax=Nostoc cycadae TaxID=246795 RepID=UPI001C9DD33B
IRKVTEEGYVESLTGYIARLAQEHCIPTGILVLSELAPVLKEGYIFQGKDGGLDQIFANQTKALNGMGKWVEKLIPAIESLTLRNDLRFLTMLNWTQLIPPRNLLRSVRAWCPICYEHWRVNHQIIYEPLLWSLNELTVCMLHCQKLCTNCPHCGKENRFLAWHSRPGYCSKCRKWLGLPQDIKSVSEIGLNEDEIKWQTWVTQNLGDLVAASFNICPSSYRKISINLSAYLNIYTQGNIAVFAQKIAQGHTQTHRWCTGKSQPTIDTLLKICFKLETSLVDFLTKEVVITDDCNNSIEKQNQYQPIRKAERNYKQLQTSQEVLESLKNALLENPPPSLIEVAERLGYRRTTTLYFHSSDLCKAIAARHAEYEKAIRLQQLQHFLEEVVRSYEYPPPSLQEIARRLDKKSVHSLDNHFPELCSIISERYAIYRQECKKRRVENLSQEIRSVAFQLHSQGIEPTASRISVHLKKPGSIIQKEAIAAVQEVRFELNLEE